MECGPDKSGTPLCICAEHISSGLEAKIAKRKIDEIRKLAIELARTLDDKLAEDVLVLDMRKLTYLTDYFILAGGRNIRHSQSLANEMRRVLNERNRRPLSVEGLPDARWVLFDCGDVVVHVFDEPTRRFYDLESLWADAPKTRWKKPASSTKSKPPKTT